MSVQDDARAMLVEMGLEIDPLPAVERKAPGRGSAVTPNEAFDIRMLHLGEGLSISQIAQRAGRTRETISGVLKHPDTLEIRKGVLAEKVDQARLRLKSSVDRAADKWVEAMDVAAEKGDHRPMKDLLLTEKVIEPVTERGHDGIVVIVGGGGTVNVGQLLSPLTTQSLSQGAQSPDDEAGS